MLMKIPHWKYKQISTSRVNKAHTSMKIQFNVTLSVLLWRVIMCFCCNKLVWITDIKEQREGRKQSAHGGREGEEIETVRENKKNTHTHSDLKCENVYAKICTKNNNTSNIFHQRSNVILFSFFFCYLILCWHRCFKQKWVENRKVAHHQRRKTPKIDESIKINRTTACNQVFISSFLFEYLYWL